MTKMDVHFRLLKPLDDATMKRLNDAHSVYGIRQIKLNSSMDGLMVEYDATRLRPAEVEAALAGAGVAVERA
jgi:hypothetical protein